MAGAYATIANDGVYIEPTFYTKIERKNGTSIIKTKQKQRRVFSKEVAYILKQILTQPVQGENGTATYCKISGVDVAAKTGTTDENYDRWLCGFTPYFTAVTWFGYDQNESIEFNQRNPAGLIWANVMSRIHTGLESATFEKPNNVLTYTICSETGMKATTGCTNTYREYFLWFTAPDLCTQHSGSELKETEKTNSTTQNNVIEIIKGITNEIDEQEPARTDNINTDSSNNTTNTTEKQNNTTNTNSNNTQANTTNTNASNTNNATSSNTNSSINNNTNTNTSNSANKTNTSNQANTNNVNSSDNTSAQNTNSNTSAEPLE